MDDLIRRVIDEINMIPLWDDDVKAQGYEPVILCNQTFVAFVRGMAFRGELKEYEESPTSAGSLYGVKVVIMEKVNCPIVGFIKIIH